MLHELLHDLLAQRRGARHARHDDRNGRRRQQRRNLRDETVADRQQRVDSAGFGERQTVVERADHEPAEHVDDEDQDAGDRVAAHELAGAVHRAVEIRFLRDLVAPCDGLLLRDEAGVQIGVDGHLLAGHRVQREPCRDFRDAPGALRHDHEVDDDEDHEHDDADGVVAADHELAERLDDLPGGIRARVTVQQHDARRGDVQPEPQQRDAEQHRREHREIQRPLHIDHGEQDHERQRDVEREEERRAATSAAARRPSRASR